MIVSTFLYYQCLDVNLRILYPFRNAELSFKLTFKLGV